MANYKVANPNFTFPKRSKILEQQSVEIDGQPGIRRSPVVGDNEFVEYLYEDAKTVLEIFQRGLKISENEPCFGYRPGKKEVPYEWMTYKEVWETAQSIGSGMLENGGKPGDFIGIYSHNTVEWGIMDKACCAYSLVSVPLYDTLGDEAIQFIIKQCELSMIMVGTNEKVRGLIQHQKQGDITTLRHVIIVDEADEETKTLAADANVILMHWSELEAVGKENLKGIIPPKRDDLYTICYTSGTTSNPKGVMITHKMIIADVAGVCSYLINFYMDLTAKDVHFSFLPLAHIMERLIQISLHVYGCSIGFFRGDVKLLFNDLATLKPTIFAMVPRLMNKLYDKINTQLTNSPVLSKLFQFAFNRKLADLKQGVLRNDTIWDKLVFRKTRALLGGRVRFCVTGAAPIKADILNFCRIVFGVDIACGYGQTEGSGVFTATLHGDFSGNTVGSISPVCHVKLIDVEEMDYCAKNGQGEVCARGPVVTSGYYKDPEKTKEVLGEDGWLRTGDVGEWMPNGSLRIIDRVKHIFKLSQGEYVAPEKIEQIYAMMMPIAQVFVHGDSLKSCLTGIVVIDEESFANWCKSSGLKVKGDLQEICEDEKVTSFLLREMTSFGKKHDLRSFEQVKAIKLVNELFSVENGLLTPTLKSKRNNILTRFRADIDTMYVDLN